MEEAPINSPRTIQIVFIFHYFTDLWYIFFGISLDNVKMDQNVVQSTVTL